MNRTARSPQRRPAHAHRRRQSGFSLVELMVSITIGLIVIAAVGYSFVASKRTFRSSAGMMQLQENARSAMLLVNSVIRNAGYLPQPLSQTDPQSFFIKDLTTPRNTLAIYGQSATSPATIYPFIGSTATPSSTSDYLAISFLGDGDSTNTTRRMHTCLGDPVDSGELAVNVLYIARNSATETVPSLYCASRIYNATTFATLRTATGQPLLLGVTNLSARYGTDSSGNRQTSRYLAASAISDWTIVTAVQITITSESADVVEAVASQQVNVSNKFQGGRLQRPLTQTVSIRNRL